MNQANPKNSNLISAGKYWPIIGNVMTILTQVVDRECERYASVPGCYYTPCSQTCMTEAAADKCPRQVIKQNKFQ